MFKLYKLIYVMLAIFIANAVFAETIKIGMLLPLSGQFAAIGVDTQQGIEIARSEIDPSTPIEFIITDSKTDPNTAITEFKKLTTIDGIIGLYAFRGPIGMAINPLSKNSHIPLLGGVGNKNFALSNEYAFQLWPKADLEGEYLAAKIHARSLKRIALITVQDDYPIAVSLGFREKVKEAGDTLSYDEEILPSDTDFRTQITKIRNSNPDAVFVNAGLNQIGPLIKQMKELGLKLPTFSNFWAGKKEVITVAGDSIEGLTFVEMSTEYSYLKQELQKRFGTTPSGATLSAYVGTVMLGQAVKGLKKFEAADLYDRLLAISEIQTKSGIFKVADRFVQFPLTLRMIKNGMVEDLNEK